MTRRDSSPRPFYRLGAPPSPDLTQNPVAVGTEGWPLWPTSQLSLQSLRQLLLICLLPLLLDPSVRNGVTPRGRKEAVPWAQPSHCQLPGCNPDRTCRHVSPEVTVKGTEALLLWEGHMVLVLTKQKGGGGSWLQCLVHT